MFTCLVLLGVISVDWLAQLTLKQKSCVPFGLALLFLIILLSPSYPPPKKKTLTEGPMRTFPRTSVMAVWGIDSGVSLLTDQ